MNVEYIPVGQLKPYAKNARKHEEYDVGQIAHSIEEYGFNDPIGIWGKDNIIVEGHGRLLAAKKLGMKEVPCIRLDDLTDKQRREYAIMHNKTAELSTWDFDLLADDIGELDFSGFDIDWGLPADVDEKEIIEDEVPEVDEENEPICKLGDIWQLGRHKLICGDSTDRATVERLMDGAKADMVFTDPPYGVSYTGGLQFKKDKVVKDNRKMIINDDKDIYEKVFEILSIFSKGACYVWFAGTKAKSLYNAAEKYGEIHALIIWVKNGGYGALNANYKQKHEPCLYWKPKNAKLNFCGKSTETTIWEINKDGLNKYHPTQKPIALCAKAIKNHIAENVLDLFGGSGSTLIACEQLNRVCYMCELDPKYCTVILKRYIAIKGSADDVFLIKDGNKIPFNEIDK